jgi:hypothetical protein
MSCSCGCQSIVHRALVTYSNSATGEIRVKIPVLLGSDSEVALSTIGRKETNGSWVVPSVGDQIIVSADDENMTNVFWLQTDRFNPSSTEYAGLESLNDVTLSSPNSGQILSYNGSQWINTPAINEATPTDSGVVFGASQDFNAYVSDVNHVYSFIVIVSQVSEYTDRYLVSFDLPIYTIFPNLTDELKPNRSIFCYFFADTTLAVFSGTIDSVTTNSITFTGSVLSDSTVGGHLIPQYQATVDIGQDSNAGYGNTALGYNALKRVVDNNLDSTENTAIGRGALKDLSVSPYYENVAVGANAGRNITSGTSNVFIGAYAGRSSSPKVGNNNNILIGPYSGQELPDNVGGVVSLGGINGFNMQSGNTYIGNGYGTLFARFNGSGNLTTPNQPTYNGDNTGGGATVFNGEVVKPPNTHFNNGSWFNQSTGRFTVSIAGYVLCSFNSLITRPINTSHAYVEFQVNGVRKSVRTHTAYDIGGNYMSLNNTAIVYCPANSYVTCNLWTPQASAYADIYGLGLTFRFLG